MILTQLNENIKKAMLDKDSIKLQALRSLKAAFVKAKTDQQRSNPSDELSADEEISVVRKAIKQRKESYHIYMTQQREDLAATEDEELRIIEQYAPAEIDEKIVRLAVATAITDVGATSMKDMKAVIAQVKAIYSGADNAVISKIAKELLSAL